MLVAIAITSAMDAGGLAAFSALPLFPLLVLFSFLERIPRATLGFRWGRPRDYGLAVAYPVIVLGAITAIAFAAGAVDLSRADPGKALLNFALMTVTTVIAVLITEEGFFRGWLFASLGKAGASPAATLAFSSVAFALWHLSGVVISEDFRIPPAQVPVYLVNAAVMGAVWGRLRADSGCVVVASVSHGLWNGIAYVLFGFGTRRGALGIEDTALFGAEVGVLGLAVNLAFAGTLWWRVRLVGRPGRV